MNIKALLLISQVASTLFMCGLIWMVQIVHYPLFALVGQDNFCSYEERHCALISLIVGPVMLFELVTAIAFTFIHPKQVRTFESVLSLCLLAGIWLSTLLFQIPQHAALRNSFDTSALADLVSLNWIRTVLWTIKSVLVLIFSYRCLSKNISE